MGAGRPIRGTRLRLPLHEAAYGSGAAVSIRMICGCRSTDASHRAKAGSEDRHRLNDKPFHIGPAVGCRRPCVRLLSGLAGEEVLRQRGAGQLLAH